MGVLNLLSSCWQALHAELILDMSAAEHKPAWYSAVDTMLCPEPWMPCHCTAASRAVAFSLGLASTLAALGIVSTAVGRAYGSIGSGLPIGAKVGAFACADSMTAEFNLLGLAQLSPAPCSALSAANCEAWSGFGFCALSQ
jgi:hypothetical protein